MAPLALGYKEKKDDRSAAGTNILLNENRNMQKNEIGNKSTSYSKKLKGQSHEIGQSWR